MRIVFSDDGKGIPPEHLGKVFDPFFTTGRSSGSTGLGLHIVYNLVTSRLQGRINLYSKLGRGTRFTIDIPKVVAEARRPRARAPERRLQLEGAMNNAESSCAGRRRRRAHRVAARAGRTAKTLVFCSEGNPEVAQSADRDDDDRHQCRPAVLQQSGGVRARLDDDRAVARRVLDDLGRRHANTRSTSAAA